MLEHDLPPSALASVRLLQEAGKSVDPQQQAKERIRARVLRRTSAPDLLVSARDVLTPDPSASVRVWERVSAAFRPERLPVWAAIREALTPAREARARLWSRILPRMQPAYGAILLSRPVKWAAAFTILLFVVRASPLLFLAPVTVADASVSVMPTGGEVSVLIGGLWQPLDNETLLRQATMLQTREGSATVVLYDDAVIRMGPNTTLAINDFSDRPSAPVASPTVFLQGGTLWVLGLVPRHLEGISIGTAHGRIAVHEGSVSIADGGQTDVRVLHRSATVTRRGQTVSLVAGEQLTLEKSRRPLVTQIPADAYHDAWVDLNLARDGAHQREIALLQQERRAASAGILPDSTLYRAKRFAEAVDVLFTLNDEDRARKIITHANTRLNEAAAILSRGSGSDLAAAEQPLREYRESMLAVASGALVSPAVESLLEHEVVAEAAADLAAALPDDSAYPLKQTVRETIAALPDSLQKPDTQTAELLDELAAVKRRADEGDVQEAKADLEQLNSVLPEGTNPDVRKEVEATFSTVTAAVETQPAVADEPPQIAEEISRATSRTLRVVALGGRRGLSSSAPHEPLSESALQDVVTQIRNRVVEGYHTEKGRQRQLWLEFQRLQGNPERGRILRRLVHEMPDVTLASYVRIEMQRAAAEQQQKVTGEACTGSGC